MNIITKIQRNLITDNVINSEYKTVLNAHSKCYAVFVVNTGCCILYIRHKVARIMLEEIFKC